MLVAAGGLGGAGAVAAIWVTVGLIRGWRRGEGGSGSPVGVKRSGREEKRDAKGGGDGRTAEEEGGRSERRGGRRRWLQSAVRRPCRDAHRHDCGVSEMRGEYVTRRDHPRGGLLGTLVDVHV